MQLQHFTIPDYCSCKNFAIYTVVSQPPVCLTAEICHVKPSFVDHSHHIPVSVHATSSSCSILIYCSRCTVRHINMSASLLPRPSVRVWERDYMSAGHMYQRGNHFAFHNNLLFFLIIGLLICDVPPIPSSSFLFE